MNVCTNMLTRTHIHTCTHMRARTHTHTTKGIEEFMPYTLRKLFGLLFLVTGLIRLEGSISSSSTSLVGSCNTSSSLLLSRTTFLALFSCCLPATFLLALKDALLDSLSSSLALIRLDLLGVFIIATFLFNAHLPLCFLAGNGRGLFSKLANKN